MQQQPQQTTQPQQQMPQQQYKQQAQPMRSPYAGFWVRFAAYIIDGLVMTPASFIIGIIISVLAIPIDDDSFIWYVIGFAITWSYMILMTHYKGATLGKMAVGVQVVSAQSNEKTSLGMIILRETIGKIVSAIILLIGYIMIGFTAKKQGLHDMMASTLVVYKDPAKGSNKGAVATVLALFFGFFVVAALIVPIALVSMSGARDKARSVAVEYELQSAAAGALLCLDDSQKLSQPIANTPMCATQADITWPDIEKNGATWGPARTEADHSNFNFSATYGDEVFTCTLNGCISSRRAAAQQLDVIQ